MIHHYITHYASNGKDYAEAWIQINIFGKCFCLSKNAQPLNDCTQIKIKFSSNHYL